MAARLNPRHQAFVKEKIRASQLINCLQNHVLGKMDLSSTQIRAAEILLGKVLSDAPKQLEGNFNLRHDARELSDDELATIASGGSLGTAGETESSGTVN